MRDAGATVGPIYNIADASADPHFQDREIIVAADDETHGNLPMHDIVPRLSATPGTWRRPAPGIGEHNAEILAEAGLPEEEIAQVLLGNSL
jgi:crotonobetainyl-CoA:carnitine CoA-transferase CaiB-like acyl-CoA transferase